MEWIKESIRLFSNIYRNSFDVILMTALALVAIILYECLRVGWQKSSLRQLLHWDKPSAKTDMVIFIWKMAKIDQMLVFALTLGLFRTYMVDIRNFVRLDLLTNIPSAFVQAIIYFIAIDFVAYWLHWLEHRVPLLWEIHKFHHSADEMNILTFYRRHPFFAYILSSLILAIPVALLGSPAETFIYIVFFRNILGFLQHSRLRHTYGSFWGSIFVSPHYHHIHHSDDAEHYNRNFGQFLVFWDYLFNTKYRGSKRVVAFGVPENPYNKNPVTDTLTSLKLVLQKLNPFQSKL